MKNLLLLFSLCPVFVMGQVNCDFENGLSDGWEQFPAGRWSVTGDNPLSGNFSFRHSYDNSESGCDRLSYYLGDVSTDSLISWSFKLHYEYKPSGSNHWAVVLLSDKGGLAAGESPGSLILGVNLLGTDDSLRLYSRGEKGLQVLSVFPLNWELDVGISPVSFIILKSESDSLEAFLKILPEGSDIRHKIFLNGYLTGFPCYFGLSYCYTSSKDRLLTLDDFSLEAVLVSDSLPPQMERINFTSPSRIELVFNENVFINPETRIEVRDFPPPEGILTDGSSISVSFPKAFQNGSIYSLEILNIEDRKGNRSNLKSEFRFYYPAYKDLVLNEIMADPSPAVYLPEEEYIELLNRGPEAIDLKNWVLNIGSKTYVLPEHTIKSGEYCVLGQTESSLYSTADHFVPLFGTSSAIGNTGQLISLENPNADLVDALIWDISWYEDPVKAEGGWSLERVDTSLLCGEGKNWKASTGSEGGSPGKVNSVLRTVPDYEGPEILHVFHSESTGFFLQLNETAKKGPEWNPSEVTGIRGYELIPPLFKECSIIPEDSSRFPIRFTLPVWMEDCNGNPNQGGEDLLLVIPQKPSFTDLLISEIMFDPEGSAPEFIEIYNRSEKVIGLKNLCLDIPSAGESSGKLYFVSGRDILFYPGEYLALNPDNNLMAENYHIPGNSCLIEMPEWKSLVNDGGKILLKDRSGNIIDEAVYNEDMHFPMLKGFPGISLERLSFGPEPGVSAGWHSASSLCNFSTPGYMNSQSVQEEEAEQEFGILPEVFTPDNDGVDDMAVIFFNLEKEGYTGSLMIFDASGRQIRTLGNGILLGRTGSFYWDGLDEMERVCQTGIYLVYLEMFHLSGNKKFFKETVVLKRTGY